MILPIRYLTKVEKGILYILNGNQNATLNVKPVVTVYVNKLTTIQTKRGSDVTSSNTLKTNRLVAYMVNGSDIKLDLTADELVLFLSDGSDAVITGKVGQLSVTSHGGSDSQALGLEAVKCMLQLSGGSDAMVNISKQLDINATGGCDISVKGNPPKLTDRLENGSKIFILKK